MDYDSDEGPDQDEVNIDDGLLDDAFDEAGVEVEPRNNNNNNNQCSSCDMAVCVMGGGNSQVQTTGQLYITPDHPYIRALCLTWPP